MNILDKKLFSNGRLTEQCLPHKKDGQQTGEITNSSHQKATS